MKIAAPLHRLASACLIALTSSILLAAAPSPTPILDWQVQAEHSHDESRFTQGLAVDSQHWIESSGGFGNAFLVIEDRQRNRILARYPLPGREFAEGASFAGEVIWMITWRDGMARKFNRELEVLREVRYVGEGWGLTWDGQRLIMSDGSDRLQFRDDRDFSLLRQVRVHDQGRPVRQLNELEYAHGLVFANVFQSDRIAVIDPEDGQVRAWLDLSALKERFDPPAGWDRLNNVLNGIAWDAGTDHFWLTGKRWPRLFEVSIDLAPLLSPQPETAAEPQ